MANEKLRAMMKQEQIFMWQIADKLGLNETTVIKKFRHELTEGQRNNVLSAIEEIKLDRLKEQK
ncbi:MAG: hypothetical protein NC548_61385 [Lachnospiraceae bacterium]|nr:hypothetical protein [Lachnospiraceae bacterium]MCM1236212.1 hypothetical protein [Ruminococcus flavefaciens]